MPRTRNEPAKTSTHKNNQHLHLHLGRHPHAPVITPPHVQRDDAHVVPSDEEGVVALVVNEKREHSSQLVQEVFAALQVQRDDRLAVRAGQRLPGGGVGGGRAGHITRDIVHERELFVSAKTTQTARPEVGFEGCCLIVYASLNCQADVYCNVALYCTVLYC